MYSSTTSKYLASFGLGYTTTVLQNTIICENDKFNKRDLLIELVEMLKTYEECFHLLFDESLEIPCEYVSDSQLVDYFTSLFQICEEKIDRKTDKNLMVYFFAGGLIYLADSTEIPVEQKKIKTIIYEMLCEVGANVTWNEVGIITSQLFCDELLAKKAAKKQILDYMFDKNESGYENKSYVYQEKIYQSLLT